MEDLTKKYYKIKDAAELIGMPQSTLRYWEKEFNQLKPKRSVHNQRYFTPEDIKTLRIIKYLIKDKGLKIEAAKEYLKNNKKNISKRIEILDNLIKVREDLELMLQSLNRRGQHLGLELDEISDL